MKYILMKKIPVFALIVFLVSCGNNSENKPVNDSVYSTSNAPDTFTTKPSNIYPKPGESAIGDTSTKGAATGQNTAIKSDSVSKH